jgi:hypothetical protein
MPVRVHGQERVSAVQEVPWRCDIPGSARKRRKEEFRYKTNGENHWRIEVVNEDSMGYRLQRAMLPGTDSIAVEETAGIYTYPDGL